ncbi:EexN family lipoprotein [Acinetobacter sp. ASP199]|uniref:EexN family lipoprotein n=1 Tax=unclassified Acinetobacter TaxID=196816 RepID=UPI001F61D70B|nr:EexN family lipoprotein [Acinetobacter sp. ASP199]UNT60242.1 EexN family lipoprotein [Acinetobacter sp. ASP199]
MKIKTFILTSCLALALTGCTKVKTQEYYAENLDEAKEVLEKCETEINKGKEVNEKFKANCNNAGMAVMNGMLNDLTKGLLN